jgi:hypothetical protein
VVVVLILDRGYLQLLQHVRKSKEEEEEEEEEEEWFIVFCYIYTCFIYTTKPLQP